MTAVVVLLVGLLVSQLGLLELADRVSVKLPGRWFVNFNPEGRKRPPNAEGNYDFRGRKLYFTRVTTA